MLQKRNKDWPLKFDNKWIWVYNGLTIEGNPDQVKSLITQMNKPFVMVHDNWNVATQQMEVKQTTYPNPVFAFHNIYNHRDAGITDEVYLGQPPRDITFEEQMQFKTNDWYSFNVREWGTKWEKTLARLSKEDILAAQKKHGNHQKNTMHELGISWTAAS